MSSIPPWASRPPPRLVENHRVLVQVVADLAKRPISPDPLDGLFAKENEALTRPIWEGLYRIARRLNTDPFDWLPELFEETALNFYDDCREALLMRVKTPSERAVELRRIASMADELSRLVAASSLAWTSVLYYHRDTLEGTQVPPGASVPRVEEVLAALAQEAREKADEAAREPAMRLRMVDGQPAPEAWRLNFIRKLTAAMRRRYGRPHYQLTADTVMVVFGIETTAEYVKVSAFRKKGNV